MATQTVSKKLSDLLATKNLDIRYTDAQGKNSNPMDADVISFDWVGPSGKNYGTVVIVLEESDLLMFFGDNLGRTMQDPQDKSAWLGSEDQQGFVQQIKNFATRNNIGTFTLMDINQLKHHMAGMAAIKEGLFEGYYGNRRVSYVGQATEARLVIKHNRVLGENDKRYRYVESLFIETADGERFRLPFNKLAAGRAMLEHVQQGGRPYDIRGCHIAETVNEMNVLARFRRASQNRVFEGATADLIESAGQYMEQLKHRLAVLSTANGYRQYFESWLPTDIDSETQLVEDIKQMFVEQTLDNRIESALPVLAKIQSKGQAMKEAEIFEAWANRLVEGTWALPDTPEAQAKLTNLMSKELIVGPDATNATEQLYDVVGDDQLFDVLQDLAQRDPRANIWDDTDVQARLAELGIQTPQSTEAEPADVAQDTAPGQQGVAEGVARSFDPQLIQILKQRGFKGPMPVGRAKKWIPAVKEVAANGNFAIGADDIIMVSGTDPDYDPWVLYVPKVGKYIYNEGMAFNLLTAKQVVKFTVPKDDDDFFEGVAEGSEHDMMDNQAVAKKVFDQNPNIDSEDKFFNAAWAIVSKVAPSMNYARGMFRDEDYLADMISSYRAMQRQSDGAEESHSDQKVKETKDDPINYNAAITSSYYESNELARIKKLALLK